MSQPAIAKIIPMDTARYCYSSVVRGYHVYQDNWEATHGVILSCVRETGNASDPFAVCVKKHGAMCQEKFRPFVHYFCGAMESLVVKVLVVGDIKVTFHKAGLKFHVSSFLKVI